MNTCLLTPKSFPHHLTRICVIFHSQRFYPNHLKELFLMVQVLLMACSTTLGSMLIQNSLQCQDPPAPMLSSKWLIESIIDRVLETKLLGYWFTTDMKTNKHVEHILAIAYKRLWAIRNLKRAGISNLDVLHFFFMKIRSIPESDCVVFHSMLTQEEANDIECVQIFEVAQSL